MIPQQEQAQQEEKQTRPVSISIEQILDNSWDGVQDNLYCHDLPYPVIEQNSATNTACIDMTNHQITMNQGFISHLSSKGLNYSTIFNGLLSHEAGHFKVVPWDLETLMMMLFKAEKICAEKKDIITNYFMDVTLNLDLMLNKHTDDVRHIYRALGKHSDVDAVLANLYEYKTGKDFKAPRLHYKLKSAFKELCKIKYTKPLKGSRKSLFRNKDGMLYSNLEQFAEILNKIIDDDKSNKPPGGMSQGGNGGGNGRGNGNERYCLSDIDRFSISAYDKDEIDKALKEVAKKLESPEDFAGIYGFVFKEIEKNNQDDDINGTVRVLGIGAGTGEIRKGQQNLQLEALIQFYTVKSEACEDMYIKPKDNPKKSGLLFDNIKSWEADDPYTNIDVFNSYCKIMPDITKTKIKTQDSIEEPGQSKSIPDLLLMIDSSISMDNPANENSNAVLGSICAARQYLKKGSRVAVVNFSSRTEVYDFSSDYNQVAEGIIRYQSGGTHLNADVIDDIVSKSEKDLDIMLITDGGIANIIDVMDSLNKKKKTNRVTILNIDSWLSFESENVYGVSKDKEEGGINVYNINHEEDIPGIIIGDMIKGGVV